MKINNDMSPQIKWHDPELDINKNKNQYQQITKDKKHKTGNGHHDSIPIVFQCFQVKAQPKPSLGCHGSILA